MIHALGAGLTRATFQKPQVQLKNATITSIWGGKLDVDLSLHNPNLFEVDATRLSYKITKLSDGDLIAEGVLNEHFNVPAKGTIDIMLPAVVSWHGMQSAGSSLVNRGATDFLISGEMDINTTVVGMVTIPFTDLQGQLIME
jgi:LEA14-like dessication related protein